MKNEVVRYSVKVELAPFEGDLELDGLQREGVISLLFDALAGVGDGVFGEDGGLIEMRGASVDCGPRGAEVVLFLDASRLEPAERAAEQIIVRAVGDTELLAGWRVTRAEVDLSEGMTGVPRLDGETASDLPPAAFRGGSGEFDEDRERTIAAGMRLRAFGLDAFGFDRDKPGGEPRVTAQLAAGALMCAIDPFMDELFEDLEILSGGSATVAEADGLLQLSFLPPQYAVRYTAGFARRFLLAGAAVTRRLVCWEWERPACVAEELALRLLIQRAKALLDGYGLLDSDAADQAYALFSDLAFADLDHEYLYERGLDGIGDEHLGFAAWFTSFGDRVPAHPYGEGTGGPVAG